MIKRIRRIIAAAILVLITLLFLDFTGCVSGWLGWVAKVQFVPAILALNVGVVALLIAMTLIFGRIYCSVICPLGILQDLLARLNPRKSRFAYSRQLYVLRIAMLIVFVAVIAMGMVSVAGLIEPYSIYGRITQSLFAPVYAGINNLLAMAAQEVDSYTFYIREVWIRGSVPLVTAVVSLVIIAILAIRSGRTYCNTICPVGTVLGFLSRFAWLRVVIDTDKCVKCRKCERSCKASCIDISNQRVDYSRCVVCGNCLDQCHVGALRYAHPSAQPEEGGETVKGRREFLVGTGLALTTIALAQEKKKIDGGLAVIEDKVRPERKTKITPPGSLSAEHLKDHCTACQLCISACPNDILTPDTELSRLMQPTVSYERGYCRPECNRCSEVCPTGAIKPITLADKSSTQIGHAVWVKKNCLVASKGIPCGNCARHCPVGAIQMVETDINGRTVEVPAINDARCIGCGACENLCPARPFTAIYVEGHETHKEV